MIPPTRAWLLPEPIAEPPPLPGWGRPVATLLARRGFIDELELHRFLDAGADDLHPVSLMADADAALDRLERAVRANERVAIWGDYDADGMSAMAIWLLALRVLGADPLRYIPSRIGEGYGLSCVGLDRLRAAGARVVVTCDCGVASLAEAEHAARLGLELVITDHHLPGPHLPRAVAVVNPRRADCGYPEPELTGAGVAYKLAGALLERAGRRVEGLAALAAIGTVADMAPMRGESRENRAIVRLGLAELAATRRPGLRALARREAPDGGALTARDLAFGIAPRINAAGRIAEAELALGLLLSEDEAEAERLAGELEVINVERQALTRAAVDAALTLAREDEGAGPLVVREDGWAPGIIGLVAGRLADALGRPTAAVTRVGDALRGSVRAGPGFHVVRALEACAHHLTAAGGHPGAGGFSLTPDRYDAFRAAFRSLPAGGGAAAGLGVDLVLAARHVDWSLHAELERLAPYGPGHAEPILAVTGLAVAEARRFGADGRHVRLRLLRGQESLDAVGFELPPDKALPAAGDRVDLVATLESHAWDGDARLRLRLVDYASAALSPIAERIRRLAASSARGSALAAR